MRDHLTATLFFLPLAFVLSAQPSVAEAGRGRHHKLYAVPVSNRVAIDGKLEDWDWSGHIESFDRSETRASRRIEFAVMYDAQALYLAAKVKDPSPMQNRHSPAADADKAWMGDCAQFRLVSDRTLPFPFLRNEFDKKESGAEVGHPLHLMLWYFTDNQQPALQIHKSFAMQPVRAEWGPHGVVPPDHFQAAYRADDDGKGYAFEYRIPWETLNAKDSHPKAGDVVTATGQFFWGDEGGLNYKECAYDIMSQPGFPWQTSACWGKLIFSERGNIPREWIEPHPKAQPPTPLTFTYELPEDGEVSVALFDKDQRIVRHIAAQARRKAGLVKEPWNGRDNTGQPLPVDRYVWKGLYHEPIRTRYVMSFANSGQPAWKTADGTGGWGGDYGPPTAAAVVGDRMILGWTGHEAGWGIIATDLAGKKKWGLQHKNAAHLATDGTRFFAFSGEKGDTVMVFAAANGQPLAFSNGHQGLQPPPGDNATNNLVTGIACHAETIYVSFGGRNVIGLYDAGSGELKTTWTVGKPGRLAVAQDSSLLAISGEKVLRIRDGKPADFIKDHLDHPAGVAVATDGQVYVSNHGKLQNISVFSAQGDYQRSIGRPGGRPRVGRFDPSGMLQPEGIAVDGQGKLWVPEAAYTLKRLSVWDTRTGNLTKEFFGGCSYSPFAWTDPENPREAFFDNAIWDIDLEKGTWYPKSIFYEQKSANSVNSGHGGFFYPFRVFTAGNGRQYAVSEVWAFGRVLWLREGDLFRPLHFMFKNRPNSVLMNQPPFPIMEDRKAYPEGRIYLWSDASGDQEAQLSELTELPNATPFFDWMDANLNLYANGVVYPPQEIRGDGVPVYDYSKPQQRIKVSGGSTWADAQGTQLWHWRDGEEFARFHSDGTKAWFYPRLKIWRDAISESSPGPGTLTGATCPLGVVGRYSGLLSYFGTADLVRDDGLFVAQLFEHPAKGNNGPHIFYVEFLAGQLVQPKGDKRVYILAGDQDCRIHEVLGLDSVKDLPGGVYDHTETLAAKAAKAWAEYEFQTARGQPLILARGGEPGLAVADPVGKALDERHAFEVRAAHDARNLYFRYTITSPSPLTNAIPDPQMIFKGGNLLDIQVGADPAADPKRTTPAIGDSRLLISQRAGKPWAVLLRPKVAGFMGQPTKLVSPTGEETFDAIAATDRVELRGYRPSPKGFEVTAVVPLEVFGLAVSKPGTELRMDVGYVFGNAGGVGASARAYWHNNSFTANVINDIPHESRLEPAEWGIARVE